MTDCICHDSAKERMLYPASIANQRLQDMEELAAAVEELMLSNDALTRFCAFSRLKRVWREYRGEK